MGANAWSVLNAYQTSSFLFAVESARRSKAVSSTAVPRKPPDNNPLQKNGCYQLIRTAAENAATMMQSARTVKQAAEALNKSANFPNTSEKFSNNTEEAPDNPLSDKPAIIKQVRELVNSYNGFVQLQTGAAGWINTPPGRDFLKGLSIFQLGRLGIAKSIDEKLEFNENDLKRHLEHDPLRVKDSITGNDGFAGHLEKTFSLLQDAPPENFLDKKSASFRSYTNYGYSGGLHTYLPVPLTGLLFNDYF